MISCARSWKPAVILMGLALFAACAHIRPSVDGNSVSPRNKERSPRGAAAEYFHDRLQDLRDVAGLAVTVGPGLLGHARGTQLFQAGAGYYTGYKLGSWHRSAGIWKQSEKTFGVAPVLFYRIVRRKEVHGDVIDLGLSGYLRDEASSFWLLLFRGDVLPHVGSDQQEAYDLDQGSWDIGAGVHIGLIGLDGYVNPVEIPDFLLGWFGLDFMGDDYGSSNRKVLERLDVPRPVWRDAAMEVAESRESAALPDLMRALPHHRYYRIATEAIIAMGGEEAVSPLIQVLTDTGANHLARDSALKILGKLARGETISPTAKGRVTHTLLDTLNDPRWGERAADALSASADWALVPTLLNRMVQGKEARETLAAGRILSRIARGGRHLTDPAFWILWWERERERHPELSELAGYDLGPEVFKAAHESPVYRSLLARLEDGTATVADLGVAKWVGQPEILGPLREYLGHHLSGKQEVHAKEALAQLEGRDPLEALLGVLQDEDPETRHTAKLQIIFMRDPRAILFYIHLLRERLGIVRIHSRIGLQAITKEQHLRKYPKWVRWWRRHRGEYPPQMLPPGLSAEDVLGERD